MARINDIKEVKSEDIISQDQESQQYQDSQDKFLIYNELDSEDERELKEYRKKEKQFKKEKRLILLEEL